jgi:hypothetical protein
MQQRGQSPAQPQSQSSSEQGAAYDDQHTQQLERQVQWSTPSDDDEPYQPQPATPRSRRHSIQAETPRPPWKTPLIAGVALIVGVAIGMAIGSSKSNGSPSATGTKPTPSVAVSASASSPPAASAARAKSIVLQTSGNGAKTTNTFTVAANWSVKYSYDCGGAGKASNFSIIQHGSAIPLPIVNTTGAKGSDTSYQHADGGQLALEINSTCDWTVTVTSGDNG